MSHNEGNTPLQQHARLRALFGALKKRGSLDDGDWDSMTEEEKDKFAAAIEDTFPLLDAENAARYLWIKTHWDDLTGNTARDPGKWLEETIDAAMSVAHGRPT